MDLGFHEKVINLIKESKRKPMIQRVFDLFGGNEIDKRLSEEDLKGIFAVPSSESVLRDSWGQVGAFLKETTEFHEKGNARST